MTPSTSPLISKNVRNLAALKYYGAGFDQRLVGLVFNAQNVLTPLKSVSNSSPCFSMTGCMRYKDDIRQGGNQIISDYGLTVGYWLHGSQWQ